jgi:putative endonuclease
MKNMYVYILQCNDGSYYTGVTNNAERRLAEHNYGISKQSYTFSRRPVEMVYCERFYDPVLAISFEKKIKGWSHKKKEALINDDWKSLVEFSKTYKIKSYKRS